MHLLGLFFVANASYLPTVANASGSDFPCWSVANASLCWPEPRIFTAKTVRTLRSIRQVRISCLPLRSLRLGGENALFFFFRVHPWLMYLLCFSSFPCNSVFVRGKCFSLQTVAHASGSDLIPCSSVANASSLLTVAHASGSDFIPLLCLPSLTLVLAPSV